MKTRKLFFTFLFGTLVLTSNSVWADYRLPNQPVGTDGYYIVKWDCENNTWASSNDMEYDETFVLAIDLTGTAYENWVKNAQSQGGVTYPVDNTIVSLNTFRGDRNNMYTDNRARLWHIRDNIYGALYNFAQFNMSNGANTTPAIGEQTKIYTRIFESATLFSDRCYPIDPTVKKGSVWSYKDNWFAKTDNQPFFVFAPYTGTKTGAEFSTEDMTPGTHIFYDNDHYVVSKGYAAPCSVNDNQCCPFFQPLDPVLQTFPVGSQAELTMVKTSGDLTGVHYQWYRYATASGKTAATTFGTDNATCYPSTDVDGSDYTYYCIVTTNNCPDGVESTEAQVIIQNPCATYTWAIDGTEGLTTPMYPGGWYMVSCTSDAGAPTITITGTNLSMAAATTSGNTTTAKVTLQGNATGDIKLTAAAPVSATYRQCPDTQWVTVGNCEGGDAYRIEWDSQSGKYMIDNAGQVGLYSAVSDKTDLWQPIYTGEMVGGQPVMYLYNLGTHRYLYRGPVQLTGNNNTAGTWDFGAVLTSSSNARTDDYKWIIYPDGDYRYIINVAGWSAQNWNRSFGIHYRNSNMGYMFCSGTEADKHDLKVCTPYMVCGKMDGQTGDPNMRSHKNKITTVQAAPEHYQTTIAWSGTAPADTVLMDPGTTSTYLVQRTDNLHSINSTITYSSQDASVATVNPATGEVQAVGGGITTITAKLDSVGCFDGAELSYKVRVKGCSPFEWAVDGTAGTTTLMYPGGWYMVSCTNSDGAPDITVTGTGITTETPAKSGNTTTVKVILQGNAEGDITMAAALSGSALTCKDTAIVPVSACTETAAESRKIEWFNYKTKTTEWPQYWIHGGASVYLRDNNGVLEADIEHQDGNDQWYITYTGQMCQGQKVFYLQNVQTQRYVCRGATHGNVGGDWEYAEALLSATNAQTDDYKWVLYENNGDTAVVNISGFTGGNLENGAYVLHVRNWEAPSLFSNPNIPSPRMVCGKMANQGGSPAFYLKGYTTTKPITQFQTQLKWKGTAPQDTIIRQQGTSFTFTAERADKLHSINTIITYESLDPTSVSVNATTGAVTVIASDGETTIRAILEEVGCFKSDTLYYVVKIFDCGLEPVISVSKTTLQKNEQIQITLTNPAETGETGTWVFSQNDGQNATITADGIFSASNVGTYKFYYKITNTVHSVCNRQSNELTIIVKDKEDYVLPNQPVGTDGEYIVLWDCNANDFAAANTMEWGETFTFAINLSGTPLGNWVMQNPTSPNGIRTVAFDRLLVKNGDDGSEHFDLDVSRLWLIRDTIFGATFNFKQIPLRNGQFFTPAMSAQTGIAVRLFGVEAAHGNMCGKAPNVSLWWQWSNNSTYSEWGGEWLEGKYVSEDDQYLFRFAPYTGKSDPQYDAQSDDPRDRWYDNGHDFSNKGYSSPCPEVWPQDQVLSLDTNTICVEKGETATLTLTSSESGFNYQLYQNGTAIGAATPGTGAVLSWTISEAGTYTIMAVSPVEGHNDWMGLCNNTKEQQVSVYCKEEDPTYLKFDDHHNTHIWSDAGNWWPKYDRIPNDTDSVVIAQPCQVDITDARTKYMTFTVNSGYDITILPTGGLTITGEITNAQQGDIYIQSTAEGTGSFVYLPTAKTYPAKVEFYCQAKNGQTDAPTWQYIGHPLSSVQYGSVYTRPNTQIYIWDAKSDHFMGGLWYPVNTTYQFAPFRGYSITQNQPTVYTYEGNLNAANAQTLDVPYLADDTYPAFYLLSNSWTAPIRIADLPESAFTGVDATVYIMNTGTYQEALNQQSQQSATGQAKQKGQYNAIPVHAAPYLQDALQVIPAMQGFFVHNATADQTKGSVTLDYMQTVYNSTYALTTESARAPQRRAAAQPKVDALHLSVENTYWADAVDLLLAENFTPHFDQGWDGSKMHGHNTALSLSVQTPDGEMAVAALNDWDYVPLTFASVSGLEYTFKVQVNASDMWYLYDRQTNVFTPLENDAEYTFRSSRNMESNRFYIRRGRHVIDDKATSDLDGKYIIQGSLVIIRNGVWYNALGGQLK